MRFFRDLEGSLDRARIFTYCGILLAVEIGVFVLFIAGTHGLIVPLSGATSTDFVSFYAAGALADTGTPELAYDRSTHYLAEQRATAPGIEYRFFYYPPVFLLLVRRARAFAVLVGFPSFRGGNLVFFLIVARRILGERGWPVFIPLLAFPGVFWTMGLGQNAFLTAALFGAATLWVDRRPVLAGVLFGALCYKPHFRSPGAGGVAGRAALARVSRSLQLGGGALRIVADPARMGDVAWFSCCCSWVTCHLRIRPDHLRWSRQPVRSGAAARRNPSCGLCRANGRDASGGISGRCGLAPRLPLAGQGGNPGGGDSRRNPRRPHLRSDVGGDRRGLADPRRGQAAGMGQDGSGMPLRPDTGSAGDGGGFTHPDRAARGHRRRRSSLSACVSHRYRVCTLSDGLKSRSCP